MHILVVFALCWINTWKNHTFQYFEWILLRQRIFTAYKVLQFVCLFQNTLRLVFYTITNTIICYSSRIRRFCCEKAKILRSEIHKDSTLGLTNKGKFELRPLGAFGTVLGSSNILFTREIYHRIFPLLLFKVWNEIRNDD